MSNLHIFAGHFGSGKTEVALNYAIKNSRAGKNVFAADIDIVNPYFRTADARDILALNNIELIASDFAGSNVDIPIMPGNILKGVKEENSLTVLDVGGDGDGAYALGSYKKELNENGYLMHFVLNTKRPDTQTAKDITEYIDEIESASRLKVTDIINNTNLAGMTDEYTLFSGIDAIREASAEKNIPVFMHTGTKRALSKVSPDEPVMEIEIYIKMPWNK